MTIREIANMTGLSSTTVHRAIRNPEKSKPDTVHLVNKVLKQNVVANIGLKKIYIILPHVNEFYTSLIIKLMTMFNQFSIQLVPFITNEDKQAEYEFISSIPFSTKIGLIWTPTDTEKTYPFLNRQKNKPLVIFFNRKLTSYTPNTGIFLDNHGALSVAVEELVKHQNSKLLFINDGAQLQTAITRKEGFLSATKKYTNIKTKIIHAQFHNWYGAYQCILEHREIIRDYDAIISGNEFLTYGILKGLRQLKLHIPDDIRFISIDDSFSIESCDISTVYFSIQQIADQIIYVFLDEIYNHQNNSIYCISARLILRGSEKRQ